MAIIRRLSASAAILLAGATAGFAQQAETTPSRWYVGMGPVLEHKIFAVAGEEVGAYLLGGSLRAGYQLIPGLTVQAGLLHGRGGSLDDNYADDGTPHYVQNTYKESVWGVPLGVRIQLSEPQRKLQVEALMGMSIYAVRQTRTYNQLITDVSTDGWRPIVSEARALNSYLDAGLGLRYVCTPRLSAVADLSVNAIVKQVGYFGIGPGGSVGLGLQYHFR